MAASNSGPFVHALITGPPGVGKTTLVKKVCAAVKRQRRDVPVSGFFTEEVRGADGRRIGFDVVALDGERSVLSRVSGISQSLGAPEVGGRQRKAPTVGKYQVDVASFEQVALKTLATVRKSPVESVCVQDTPVTSDFHTGTKTEPRVTSPHSKTQESDVGMETGHPVESASGKCLIVIDEIGKMELFSRKFTETVQRLFEDVSGGERVVLATVPIARHKSHWLLDELRHRRECKLFQVSERNRDNLVEEVSAFILQRL